MHFARTNEEGWLSGSMSVMFDNEEEMKAAKTILEALRGFPIVVAASILKRSENALHQSTFDEDITV